MGYIEPKNYFRLFVSTVRAIQAKKKRPARKARNQNQQNHQQPVQPPSQVQSPTQPQAPPVGKQNTLGKAQNNGPAKGKNKGGGNAGAAAKPPALPVKEELVPSGVEFQHALNDVLDHVLEEDDDDLRLQSCPDFLQHTVVMQQQ